MTGEKRYRTLSRTSDLALKIAGKTQAELLENSAYALFDVLTDIERVQAQEKLSLEVDGVDRHDLIANWVRELLYLFQGGGYLIKECRLREVRESYARGEVSGEKFDPDRHEIRREIRSVIYDQTRMEKTGDLWTAQVVLEI
ncbi:MAG: archease [Deltaproteobacteria bacterium]|nr:archease [Deltaproteobacteria bacterium]